jgi:hypothetical protein
MRPKNRNIDVSLFKRVLFKSLPYLSNWIIKKKNGAPIRMLVMERARHNVLSILFS